MAWEYAGLFDAIVDETQQDLLTEYWKSQPTAIRVGSMGYRTRTVKAGTRLEAEIYPIFGREKTGRLKAAKQRMSSEKQKEQNIRQSKRRLILLLEANFQTWKDNHVTLTYAGDELPDFRRIKKDMRNFFSRVKRLREKLGLDELKYIYAIGHDQNQRPHVHCVLSGGMDRSQLERLWGHGNANNMELQGYGSGLQGIANYLFKQNESAKRRGERFYLKSWTPSRNLKKPKEHVSDSKVSNRRVKIIAQDFRNEAKEIMERVYPEYTLENCGVFYSDVVDGVYIRCVMRRKEGVCSHSGEKRNMGRSRAAS